MLKISIFKMLGRCNFSLQYVDQPSTWTIPVLLTADRLDKFIDDKSVVMVRLTPNGDEPLLKDYPEVKEIELKIIG